MRTLNLPRKGECTVNAKKPKTVAEYIAGLSEERKEFIVALRQAVTDNLQDGFEEGIQYGMIGYYVPHSLYPSGYHCDASQPLPYTHIASQKSHVALYSFCVYGNEKLETWFRNEWAKTGLKLDMGKSCIRFKKLSDAPLDLIGRLIAKVSVDDFISDYERNIKSVGKKRTTKKAAPKKAAPKKAAPKKAAPKKAVAKKKVPTKKKAAAKKK